MRNGHGGANGLLFSPAAGDGRRPIRLKRLLQHLKTRNALISAFLALLELVRLQAILLRQKGFRRRADQET